jgi:hypothetical protein
MAAGGMGIGIVGGKAKRGAVIRKRPIAVAFGVIGEAAQVVGIGHIGIELQGLAAIGDGGIEFAAVLQGLAAIGIGPGDHRRRIPGSADDGAAGLDPQAAVGRAAAGIEIGSLRLGRGHGDQPGESGRGRQAAEAPQLGSMGHPPIMP